MNDLVDAAKAIVYQRDYFAANGRYDASRPNPAAEPEQEFDDWAADILATALAPIETGAAGA